MEMHKPVTDGYDGSVQQPWPTDYGNIPSLNNAGSNELMWLLLERLMDFSMQCRNSANAYARSQSGHVSPILQELMSLLRNPGQGYGNTYGGGYNGNSYLLDKVSYLVSKLEQYDQNHQMNQYPQQMPSAGPVLEILFQMLRNQNTTPAGINHAQQAYPEHIQKHLKELGDRMMKMGTNVPAEGQTLELLYSMLSAEMESNPEVTAKVFQDKNRIVHKRKGSFDIYAQYNPNGSPVKMEGPNGSGGNVPAILNGSDSKDETGIFERLEKQHIDIITSNAMNHIEKGYRYRLNGKINEAKKEFEASQSFLLNPIHGNDKKVLEMKKKVELLIDWCTTEEEYKKKNGRKPWWKL